MKRDVDIIFFDLFFTLVIPRYNNIRNENDVLGITKEEWEKYAEDDELYLERASGREKNPLKIIENIIKKIGLSVSENEKREILELRQNRFRKSLKNIDFIIINTLLKLKNNGKKLCLISNSDIIDAMYWNESPLKDFFDEAIFSYEAGYLKPHHEIYKIALKKMNAIPEKCFFVGDGGSDELRAAKELGIKTIQTGYLVKREIKEHETIKRFADYYIENFEEIINIINY